MSDEKEVWDRIIQGDSLNVLKSFPENSFSALVTDPPAGINFMNKEFDHDRGGRQQWIAWLTAIMQEAHRVLKPGAYGLVWALPRTSHWTATALEDAGFEIRDCVYHLFGSGFPKSLDVSKAIDKHLQAEREVLGIDRNRERKNPNGQCGSLRLEGFTSLQELKDAASRGEKTPSGADAKTTLARAERSRTQMGLVTAPATQEAQQWSGFGSALKPSVECWWLVRKPLSESSIAENVLKWGVGALNIDACRISTQEHLGRFNHARPSEHNVPDSHPNAKNLGRLQQKDAYINNSHGKRWPSHLLLSHSLWCTDETCEPGCPIAGLDAQSGYSKSRAGNRGRPWSSNGSHEGWKRQSHEGYHDGYSPIEDAGGASRFFTQLTPDVPFLYTPKASRSERNKGCEELPETMNHSTSTHSNGQGHTRMANQQERANGITSVEMKKTQNHHPTVKSISLMSWLVRLACPPGGLVLDSFCGSGSTCVACIHEGMHFIGVEQDESYVEIARARIAHARGEIGLCADRQAVNY
jgi:site-specific DNA-methyltransferase (adenine-specific)